MQNRKRSNSARAAATGTPRGAWVLATLAAAVALGGLFWLLTLRRQGPLTGAPAAAPLPAPPEPFRQVVWPTAQQRLLDREPAGVFQPTASGKPESALYGSVRTAALGRGLAPSFHEGIDIAPVQRDRRGQPLDAVHAVAAGAVAYINRAPGNSNYGIYVVLLHPDPVGDVYTLYAHLATVAPGLQAGLKVSAGAVLGTMGHTPARIIPLARAHLHFEIGLLSNANFGDWFRRQRLKPDHGAYNGWNLLALDPLMFFAAHRADAGFSFRAHMARIPCAFEAVLVAPRQLDFFRRYPRLWASGDYAGGAMVLACSENGVPLSGRAATADEARRLGGRKAVVLKVDERVLGRNGAHLVARAGSGWQLGRSGERWLQVLTWPAD